MIQFNYKIFNWNLFPIQTGRISFVWKEASSCLAVLRGCITQGVIFGAETLFLKDWWLNGSALMFLWSDAFRDNQHRNDTIRDLAHLLDKVPFLDNPDTIPYSVTNFGTARGKKWWALTANGSFFVKCFDNFRNDGGMRWPIQDGFGAATAHGKLIFPIGWSGRTRSFLLRTWRSEDVTGSRQLLV